MTDSVSGGRRRPLLKSAASIATALGAAVVLVVAANGTVSADTPSKKTRSTPTPTPTAVTNPGSSEQVGSASSTDGGKLEGSALSTALSGASAGQADQYRVTKTDGEGVRLREVPGLEANIVGRLPEGALVVLLQGAAKEKDGERWLPVKSELGSGWVAAQYLVRVKPQAAPQTTNARVLPVDAPFTDRVANIALKLVGQPYVWAGNSPGGFDCSGFVQWVYAQAGLKIMPRLIEEQMTLGLKVDGSPLPGDMVIFVNTYRSGISHTGIYLGSNLFVHAADEAQGVTISNMQDDYWKPRFLRAIRVRPSSGQSS